MKRIYVAARASIVLLLMLAGTRQVKAQHKRMHQEAHSDKKNVFVDMMDRMMVKMDNAPKDVSAEDDFLQQMIPHHEGAVEMATYEIKHGKYFEMIQLAKSIFAEQTNELQQMRLWLKQRSLNKTNDLAAFQQGMSQAMNVMMENMPAQSTLTGIDYAFAAIMIPHHQAAIDMASVAIKFSEDAQTNSFANHIISSQQVEIGQMSSFLNLHTHE